MARTYRNLWPQVVSWDNLVASYRKCRRRKRYRQPATQFDFAWEENLLVLQRELLSGEYQHGNYYHFHIREPKPRMISAAPFRDRIVHHALVSVLEPVFERRFIFDSYACRKGKGTLRAIRRAQHFQRRFEWCLKTDIVKFFPSVDHEILLATLRHHIRDNRVSSLIEEILRSGAAVPGQRNLPFWFAGDDLLAVLRCRGLPIGNLTSQFFANVYLDPIDHFIRQELQVGGYVRYADDLLLFGDSKAQMWNMSNRLAERLEQRRLRMHGTKTHLSPTTGGITFLGFRVSAKGLRLTQQGIRRFVRRTRKQIYDFRCAHLRLSAVSKSMTAWHAHCRVAASESLRGRLVAHARFSRSDSQR